MGQYYNILIKQNKNLYLSDRRVDGEYQCAKLMEHSWLKNWTLECVAHFIYNKPSQLYWVGDYAKDVSETINGLSPAKIKTVYNLAHKENNRVNKIESFKSSERVAFKDKCLVNFDKKIYININEYEKKSIGPDGWSVNPLSLLTAIGNGLGGGDYIGINQEKVGSWAGDLISVMDAPPLLFENKTSEYIFREGE